MEFLIASAIGMLTACGCYLILRARSFAVVLGMTLLSYAINLFLFSTGGWRPARRRFWIRACRRSIRCPRRWC